MSFKKFSQLLFVCFSLQLIYFPKSFGSTSSEGTNSTLEHIKDDYQWHFASINHRHYSIYLPIILYESKARGWVVFSSRNFYDTYHQKKTYQGYYLNDKKKIAAMDPNLTYYNFSITKNILAILISMLFLILMMFFLSKQYQRKPNVAFSSLRVLIELVIIFVRDSIAIPNIGKKHYHKFMPYLLTVFSFIWINNLLGLLPGAANVTGNISVTFSLALFTLFITILNGNKHYWGHIFNPPGVPKLILPILFPIEVIGIFIKPFSLMLRLFANITAGHIILLSVISLIFLLKTYLASLISIPFGGFIFFLELLVAFLQAYVFTLLSAIYFGEASKEHGEESH